MSYILTNEQYARLSEYFELALSAISDDEQMRLLSMEPGLRDMLRQLRKPSPNESNRF